MRPMFQDRALERARLARQRDDDVLQMDKLISIDAYLDAAIDSGIPLTREQLEELRIYIQMLNRRLAEEVSDLDDRLDELGE